MSEMISSPVLPPVPSLSDLTTVSLDAAIQLDRILHDRTADYSPLRRLSESLRAASNISSGGTVLSLHCNPAALGVLSRAVEGSDQKTLNTVGDLVEKIGHYVAVFSKDPKVCDKPAIEHALAFCLSLHRELIAEISKSEVVVPSDDWTGEQTWTS
jgi:hypothetical protein